MKRAMVLGAVAGLFLAACNKSSQSTNSSSGGSSSGGSVLTAPVDYLNDPNLIEKAVAVDSTGRLQTVWQVQLMDLSNSLGATCDSDISGWPPPASAGLLTTGTTPTPPSGPAA